MLAGVQWGKWGGDPTALSLEAPGSASCGTFSSFPSVKQIFLEPHEAEKEKQLCV